MFTMVFACSAISTYYLKNLGGSYYYPDISDEQLEAQRGKQLSQRHAGPKLEFKLRSVWL